MGLGRSLPHEEERTLPPRTPHPGHQGFPRRNPLLDSGVGTMNMVHRPARVS